MAIYLLDNSSICTGPVELPIIPGIGVQLPGNAVEMDAELPLAASGNVWLWTGATAVQIADRRGPAYRTDNGDELQWAELGELPEGLTDQPRPGPLHIWTPEGWKLDQAAEHAAMIKLELAARDGLLYEAGLRIAPLQDAVDLEKATKEEKELLRAWKSYRVDLNRIEDQAGFPSNIDWPTPPESNGRNRTQ
jgi:hypothetical protein